MDRELERSLRDLEVAARGVRRALEGHRGGEPEEDLSARRMLSVLAEVDRRGGRVSGEQFLAIGEAFGYRRRGMAGFYQELVRREGSDAVLTEDGRVRLEELAGRFEELPAVSLSPPADIEGDPYLEHVAGVGSGSGEPYDAGEAKRELYRTPS